MTLTQTETAAQGNRALRLSIVTVVWNDPEGLDKTLQSLAPLLTAASPEKLKFEHIVVDSSPDRHGRVFLNLSPGYPLVRIATGKNGIYAAMNEGGIAAQGELIWFLNAGDTLINPLSLLEALPLLDSQKSNILCGPVSVGSPEGEIFIEPPSLLLGTFGKNKICHQAVIYPRQLLKKFSFFDLRYPLAADFHLHLRMLLSGVDMNKYESAFARFELGGASSQIWPAFREFSASQRELNKGYVDAVLRQLSLLKEGVFIAISQLVKKILGRKVHFYLKKLAKERK